jgi:predicted Zn-dependent protease
MKKTTCGIIILTAVTATHIAAAEPRLPSFLPAYYAPAFSSGGKLLNLVGQGETNGVTQYVYSTTDEDLALSVENIPGDQPKCDAVFNNILGNLNQVITTNKGSFAEITTTEAYAEVTLTNAAQTVFTFMLPSSVQIWTFSRAPTDRGGPTAAFKTIRSFANRQRYEEALQAGNVSMGHWQKCIHDYAKELLEFGRKDDALIVLKDLLATAPFDYEAHLEFMANAPASASATNSAKTVFKNAEAQDQIVKAAEFMGVEPRTLDAFAPLATNETGLQVILIPLPPCNPWLLDEAAKVFERITEVPVRIKRLNEVWTWGPAERISRERDIQGILVEFAKENIDFTGWTKDRYVQALKDAVKSEDALSNYWVRDLADKAKDEPGQFFVDPYLDRLCATLENHRSKDNRTMYVAITEANIFSGDNNYVFSLGTTDRELPASIMSYHMMLGRTLNETYDSRQRLVERIAKELVPASLKQLGIPRSTDPTCPYSYSSGVDRLDQKTLTLSDEVKEALNKLKDPATGSSEP